MGYNNERIKRRISCEFCGNEFIWHSDRISRFKINKHFCSKKCQNRFHSGRMIQKNPMKGKYHTDKTKDKIREKARGRIPSKKARENISLSHKGFRHSEETKKKISEKTKGKSKGKREKNSNWRGGIGKLPYPYEFNNILKEQIRQRDDFTCQNCKKKQKIRKFPIHHIDYNKKNNEQNNLITLCMKCHGKTSYNRKYWKMRLRLYSTKGVGVEDHT